MSPDVGTSNEALVSHERISKYMHIVARDLQRERAKPIAALDVGSGRYGTGRIHLMHALHDIPSTIYLHDPHEHVERSNFPNVRVLTDQEEAALRGDDIDWINFSYVLTHMKDVRAAIELVTKAKARFPKAFVTTADYTLLNRPDDEALGVLTQTNAERRERTNMADDAKYISMHSRFSRYALEKIFTNMAHMKIMESLHVDTAKSRAFVAAR